MELKPTEKPEESVFFGISSDEADRGGRGDCLIVFESGLTFIVKDVSPLFQLYVFFIHFLCMKMCCTSRAASVPCPHRHSSSLPPQNIWLTLRINCKNEVVKAHDTTIKI